jgi:uncharacterized protein
MNDQQNIEQLIEHIVAGVPSVQLEMECKGVDLNEIGKHGRTPLMAAAVQDSLEVVEALVRNGASVQAAGIRQMTALHEASANGRTKIANYLLLHGAGIDEVTADGVTPLMCAAAWGNLEVAKLLLESGADWSRTDHAGATASDIAREKGEDNTADLIDAWSGRDAR